MNDIKKIIGGLEFTKAMTTFNPSTGEEIAPENLNELDKLTYDACMGAIALLKKQQNEIWELQEQVEYLTDKQKEQDAVESKWTSIKERYPDKEGFYLVSADHGNYHPWIAEMLIIEGIKGFCNGAMMPCVGAWMPLPEPYKEGR